MQFQAPLHHNQLIDGLVCLMAACSCAACSVAACPGGHFLCSSNPGQLLQVTSVICALHVSRLISSCPACLWLQPGAPSNPRAAAEALVQALPSTSMLDGTPSLAGPGFINLKVTQDFLGQRITDMLKVVLVTC